MDKDPAAYRKLSVRLANLLGARQSSQGGALDRWTVAPRCRRGIGKLSDAYTQFAVLSVIDGSDVTLFPPR